MRTFASLVLFILISGCKLKIEQHLPAKTPGVSNDPVLEYPAGNFSLKFEEAVNLAPSLFDDGGAALSSCSISPALPDGLSLSDSDCRLTGAATELRALSAYTVTATSSSGKSASSSLNIEVIPDVPSLSYLGVTGTSVSMNSAMNVTPLFLNDKGSAISNCSISPALPAGLAIDPSTCAISGTPTTQLILTNFTVTAQNAAGSSVASVSLEVLGYGAPNEVASVSIASTTTNSIGLSWVSGGGTTAGFRISYQSGGSAPADCSSGTQIDESSISGTSHNVTGLAPNTQYSFRVCAINGNPTPDVSSGLTISETTQDEPEPEAVNFLVLVDSTTSVRLDWQDGGVSTTGYRISYQLGASAPSDCSSGTQINEGSITGTNHTVSGLSAGQQYSFRLCTIDGSSTISSGVTQTATLKQPMISSWVVNSDGESIILPLRDGYNYNAVVDWGDGSPYSLITSSADTDMEHEYASAGTYTITISGLMEAWYFYSSGTNLSIISVANFGDLGWINLSYAFAGCENLVSFAGGETTNVTDMSNMFAGTTNLSSIDLSTFNTSNVTNMAAMFSGASTLVSLDLSSFSTVNVTNMSSMFAGLSSLASINLNTLNTSNVTDMSYMFADMQSLTSLNISFFNTIKVTNMAWMFSGLLSLTSLDISSLNTTNVTNMSYMFYETSLLATLDLSSFRTPNVTNMSGMFQNTSALETLDLSLFDTEQVTDMSYMFSGASSFVNLNLNSFNTGNVTNMKGMFSFTNSLVNLNLSSFNTANVINMSSMFTYAKSLLNLSLSSFNTSQVTDMTYMFAETSGLTNLNLGPHFYTNNVTNMSYMFRQTGLTSFDFSGFDTSKVTAMVGMFNGSEFTTLDLSSFDTSKVTNMEGMFLGASLLTNLNVMDWDISPPPFSSRIFDNTNPALVVRCNQGGSPGTGSFFGKTCSP